MTGIDCIATLRALGELNRLRMVRLLLKEQLGANQISERLAMSQYNVSKHLRILREAGLGVHAGVFRDDYVEAALFGHGMQVAPGFQKVRGVALGGVEQGDQCARPTGADVEPEVGPEVELRGQSVGVVQGDYDEVGLGHGGDALGVNG